MDGRLTRSAVLLLVTLASGLLSAEEAQWIWSPTVDKTSIQTGAQSFFRKSFNLSTEAVGRIEIAADDTYELYLNGRRLGTGEGYRQLERYDVSRFLVRGRNVVAIRVQNTRGQTAALACRVLIQPSVNERWYSFSSDASWNCSPASSPTWQTLAFNERSWQSAQEFGILGGTMPWDHAEDVVQSDEHHNSERFQIQSGFSVQRVLDDKAIGSIIAMEFNEFGHIIASQERGPLLLVFDRDRDGVPEEVRTYCDEVTSCQGILPLNGEVFVTGQGPEGPGLYRLTDKDRNGTLERVKLLVEFTGEPGEHGAHAVRLGPDGMLYVILGNHTGVADGFSDKSTLRDFYEGDLVTPRYEDPGGHANGIKAPAGTLIRTDLDGTSVEVLAGGLRNAYDFVFHPDGGILVHDSDMESDEGANWYRPTTLYEIVEGGEYGWRSGWAKWPDYYPDRMPNLLETGRGSPTGAAVYEHYMFPVEYHNSLFLADWAEGRILAVRLRQQGGGYAADSEVFLQGQPLNVTDLAIAKDGSLYFCTGGRGTGGGIYRVQWDGTVPERLKNLGTGIAAAIRQPQLDAAWSRQRIATLKEELGDQWGELVAGVAFSEENPAHYRLRALDLMQLFGPSPSEDLLIDLSRARNEAVRARAATALALKPSERVAQRLGAMLADGNPRVRRAACEALLRGQMQVPADQVIPLLGDEDRRVAFVARRVLESLPMGDWSEEVLSSDQPRTVILGGLALVTAEPTEENALRVVQSASQVMQGFVSDQDFVYLLRLLEVALEQGKIDPAKVPALRDQVAEEFPAGNGHMNRELARLAAYLNAATIAPRALDYLESDAPIEDRVQVGMYLRYLDHQWTASERFDLLKFYEGSAQGGGGSSYPLYLMHVTRDFARMHLTPDEAVTILEEGKNWPNAALGSLYKVPRPVSSENAQKLMELDRQISGVEYFDDVYMRLRTGIVALLATADSSEAQEYLRQVWRTDPQRRQPVALALALQPEGENWDYLVRSFNVLEGTIASDVLGQLAKVPVATDDPEALRQLILLGLRNEQDGISSEAACRLLTHWTGLDPRLDPERPMQAWQDWYASNYPDRQRAELPAPGEDSRWDLEQLMEYLASNEGKYGDPHTGNEVFVRATCASCHRFGSEGQSVGPDLTSVAKRFTRREIVESMLYPSHIISDQYRSKKVLTLDGKVYTGLVSEDSNGQLSIRDARNEVTRLAAEDVDQILPAGTSIMPDGLLDELSLRDISDLMAYLGIVPPVELAERRESTTR